MVTYAWVGLGNMGSRMAQKLVEANHIVYGFDINKVARDQASRHGVRAVESLPEAVKDADAVFTMLPNGEHVRRVFASKDGIWAHAPQNAILIDSSTVDIGTSRFCHRESGQRGFSFVDAPVSGGISGAAAGTLTFMIGGDLSVARRAQRLVEPMANNVFLAGTGTKGIATKLVNNMMVHINLIANSEGSQLAEALGLDAKVFWDIISASSGMSWTQQTWYPVPGVVETSAANNNFEAGFAANLSLKDVTLALQAGEHAGLNLPGAELAQSQLKRLVDEGLGFKDCTLIVKYVQQHGRVHGYND
ncbi:NAD(P)-dependent oxidoreductase [Auritidibacter ignavus]|uniref:NAD(P)-binding domain-containing protein n=1 Tax=Auritidibacter ignavus TaxID=678932 RepID=A0AAJ6DC39_9MICC|nr:NAD(P)-binding domain-containing protein [Auritidibacter ignavus]RMX22979.1 3-hydroxyisobutyrate dehydrogenase [Auritidibacter ignavus]WGH92746.1 NAD(P)-binding domain-containing protein [Auritidibacter ignavus]